MHKTRYRKSKIRQEKGSFNTLILGLLLVAGYGMAAMGTDIAHLVSAKAQLQNAVDAGALAGARDLLKLNPSSQDKTNANTDAFAVTAANVADSTSVSNQTPNTTVSVSINAGAQPFTVTVQATRQAKSLLAAIFGAPSEPVSTKAVAETAIGVKAVSPNQLIDIAVSLDWAPPKGPQAGRALETYLADPPGQQFTVDLNSQQSKNAAWIKDWGPFANPEIFFGTTPVQLDNGVRAVAVANLSVGDTILLPIIMGAPPYNYQTPVIGVVSLQITQFHWPQQITGILVTPIVRGIPGQPFLSPPPDPQGQQYLTQFAPRAIQLVQ